MDEESALLFDAHALLELLLCFLSRVVTDSGLLTRGSGCIKVLDIVVWIDRFPTPAACFGFFRYNGGDLLTESAWVSGSWFFWLAGRRLSILMLVEFLSDWWVQCNGSVVGGIAPSGYNAMAPQIYVVGGIAPSGYNAMAPQIRGVAPFCLS